MFPRGAVGAIWDEDVAARWIEFLEVNEAALDSFEVLFDLAVLAPDVLGGLGAALLRPRLEPLTQRGAEILDRLLAGRPQLTLPPATPVHRAAAALLGVELRRMEAAAVTDPDAELAAMERLARLMPDDPLVREALVIMCLNQGADQRALDAATRSGARHRGAARGGPPAGR